MLGQRRMALRILLVDREGRGRVLLARALSEADLSEARVDHCRSVSEAVARLVEETYDLAFIGEPQEDLAVAEAMLRLVAAAPACTVLPLAVAADSEHPPQADIGWLSRALRRLAWHRSDQRRLAHWATHDRLTGLANRWLLEEKVADAVARARRSGVPGALLFVDLDGFKAVNDCFGHDAGDLVLQTTANRLRDSLRACDTVARFGGDEFVVLVEGVGSERAAFAVAAKIRKQVSEPVPLPHGSIQVSCSLGIVFFPSQGEDLDALLRQADRLMYRSKSRHRPAAVA